MYFSQFSADDFLRASSVETCTEELATLARHHAHHLVRTAAVANPNITFTTLRNIVQFESVPEVRAVINKRVNALNQVVALLRRDIASARRTNQGRHLTSYDNAPIVDRFTGCKLDITSVEAVRQLTDVTVESNDEAVAALTAKAKSRV